MINIVFTVVSLLSATSDDNEITNRQDLWDLHNTTCITLAHQQMKITFELLSDFDETFIFIIIDKTSSSISVMTCAESSDDKMQYMAEKGYYQWLCYSCIFHVMCIFLFTFLYTVRLCIWKVCHTKKGRRNCHTRWTLSHQKGRWNCHTRWTWSHQKGTRNCHQMNNVTP